MERVVKFWKNQGFKNLRDYKVAKTRIIKPTAKLREQTDYTKNLSRIDRQWSSPTSCPNIWNHLTRSVDTVENARPTRDELRPTRLTAGGPQMLGDYGVYSPPGYWSHCAPAYMKRATLVELLSLLSVSFEMDPKTGEACSLSSLWWIPYNLWMIAYIFHKENNRLYLYFLICLFFFHSFIHFCVARNFGIFYIIIKI